jgi:hemoglobin-like flavoprotein/Ran GTPase-activating protein (RanGAP) involved in mRNA processing and transport/tRNA A-37 threonylcarbamoyl transferase component Bud32
MTYCHLCSATLRDEQAADCPDCSARRPSAGWPVDHRLGATLVGQQYRVLRRLGSGGFGTVYLVETVVGGLKRALKVLHPQLAADMATRERFVNEALVLEQMNHPNITRCYAVGTLDGSDELYLLLEYINGAPLAALLAEAAREDRTLDPLRAVRLAKQIASGLVLVHHNRVLHRDLTPQNVLIVGAGAVDEQVKLVDFGIADALDPETVTARAALGTPAYMAPEQLQGDQRLDRRTDLWQLGALLYQMLTGARPVEAKTPSLASLLAEHRQYREAGPSPGLRVPALAAHPSLDGLVSRLLAANPECRPRSAADVCEELARIEHTLAPGDRVDGALALLEALCARPSEEAWWAVCRYLLSQDEPARLAHAAERLLAEWPDAVRRAPLTWWEKVKRGEEHALWPLARRLDLSGLGLDDDAVTALAGNPALSSLTVLALRDNQVGPAGAAALAASPHLTGLRHLDLTDNRIGSAGAHALAASAALRLVRLDVAGNGLGPRGAEVLAHGHMRPRELDLSANEIGPAGAAAIAGGSALTRLERLILADNAIGSDGISAIAVSRTLTHLVELDVSHNAIGTAGAAALALAPNMGRLVRLSLARNTIGLEGLELLVASNRLPALEELDLASNDIGAQGAMSLASSPFARRLKALNVADNSLGDAGLAALLGAPYLTRLRTLGLAQNGITAAGVTLLGGAPPELVAIDLSANPLGAAGAGALAAVLPRLRLTALQLSDCELAPEGAGAIVRATPDSLGELSLAGNGLGPAGAATLAAAGGRLTLRRLDVSRNDLEPQGLAALLGWPALRGLEALVADANRLGDGAGVAIATGTVSLTALHTLRLRDNQLGATAVQALSASALPARLRTLDLALNQLGDEGASVIGRAAAWQALGELNLERNGIGLAAAVTVLSSPGLPLLYRASFARNALSGLVDLHSLSRRKIQLLESSFAHLASNGTALAEGFYQRLFARYPSIKPLFAHTSMRRQHHHMMAALTMVIDHLRAPDEAAAQLRALGERHVGYHVYPSHYQAATSVLVEAIRDTMGGLWTEDLEAAWHDGLEAVATAMIEAQQERDRTSNLMIS